MSTEEVDMKEVQRQLSKVIDPEIGVPIMEMNLIDKLDIKDGNVDIQYHATTPYCPPIFALKISQDMKSSVQQVKGVKGRQGRRERPLPRRRRQQAGQQARGGTSGAACAVKGNPSTPRSALPAMQAARLKEFEATLLPWTSGCRLGEDGEVLPG